MWTIFIWFYVFLFAINGFMLYSAEALPQYSLISPFTNTTITPPAQPDPIATLSQINATTATNSTGGSGIGIWEITNYAWNSTIFIWNLLTGGYIWTALASWGIPDTPFAIIQGTIAIFGLLTGLHFWRGIL
jgi:hypothetical protein